MTDLLMTVLYIIAGLFSLLFARGAYLILFRPDKEFDEIREDDADVLEVRDEFVDRVFGRLRWIIVRIMSSRPAAALGRLKRTLRKWWPI